MVIWNREDPGLMLIEDEDEPNGTRLILRSTIEEGDPVHIPLDQYTIDHVLDAVLAARDIIHHRENEAAGS